MPPPKVTLTVDKTDIVWGQRVKLRGTVEPRPEQGERPIIKIGTMIPGVEYSEGGFDVRVKPDGTFAAKHRPDSNLQYTAGYPTTGSSGGGVYSEPVMVYTDYGPQIEWRRLRGGVVEAGMLVRAPAGSGLDYLGGRIAYFYGFRRGSRVARLAARTRVFYTDPYSSAGRAAAYVKRKVRGGRRIQYMFACVALRHVRLWGRPDDPIRRQCGRRVVRLPAG
jgi:hypothetical protein